MDGLFDDLCYRLGLRPDHRGYVQADCPWCGKEAKRGQSHFSFNAYGGSCFVCGEHAGLREIARLFGVEGDGPAPARHAVQRPKAPRPAARPHADFEALALVYATRLDAVAAWQAYKPISAETVRAYRLGLGPAPLYASKCPHERLQVPLIAEGRVVGFRSRTLACGCAKWLSPGGSKMILYNGERLLGPGPGMGLATAGLARGRVLWIVENPIDALMLEALRPDFCAVATLGVSMWQTEWTAIVRASVPRGVMVCYDNDRPGNGGGERGRAAWMATHPRDIMPNGVRLVNALLAAGVRARLYDWGDAPLKADIGDMLKEGYDGN